MPTPSRSLAVLSACAASLFGQQPSEAKARPKIVFVCEHGAAKSIIAAAEFERMSKARGLDFVIVSRGTNPDPQLALGVVQGLKRDGMEVGSLKPAMLSAKDLKNAARVITFGPDLTQWLPTNATVLDWSAAPAPSKDYTASRDYIRRQLETLLDDIGRNR